MLPSALAAAWPYPEHAHSPSLLVMLVLDAHVEREGKDNHALALLETAHWLHARLAQLLEAGRRSSAEVRSGDAPASL